MADSFTGKLAAIILAAGEGRRLASLGPKPFLMFHDKCFLQIVIEHLKAIQVTPIIIVTNPTLYARVIDLNLSTKILINPHPEQGMISSLWIGLTGIDADASGFFMCPIDYPLVKRETYRCLSLAHFLYPEFIIIPTVDDCPGHPVIFSRGFIEELKHVPLDQGAKWIIRNQPHRIRQVEVDDPGILININTPELYRQYCSANSIR